MNPMIAMGGRPVQIDAPEPQANQLMKLLQLQGAVTDMETGRLKADEYKRGVTRNNRMEQILAGGGDAAALRIGGFLKEANEWDKNTTDLEHKRGETTKNAADTTAKVLARYRDQLANVNDQQTAAQWVMAQYADPILGKALSSIPADSVIKSIPADAQGFQQWRQQQALGMTEFIKQNAPKTNVVDTGATTQIVQTPGLGGAPQVAGTFQNTQSPNNAATVGASMANASATREIANATRDAASIRRDQDTEMKLADDYRGQSKNFKDVVDAAARVKATLPGATKSAASTLSAATSFMKLLDPGSVVRESELVMALQATGALDRALNYVNVLQNGKVLTPSQVQDFSATTDKILQAAKEGQRNVDTNYRGQAEKYKLRPEMIIQDLGQNKAPTANQSLLEQADRIIRGGK